MMAVEESLHDVAVLIDQLHDSSPAVRIQSLRRLDHIATVLGPDRTRNELLPFLKEAGDDEDEAVVALAEEYGKLGTAVGGPAHMHYLLVALEPLVSADEGVVRNAAVHSINTLSQQMSKADIGVHVIPMLRRLVRGEWFTCRLSSCALFQHVYTKCDEQTQLELREMYRELSRDDLPAVRRSASSHLAALVGVTQPDAAAKDFLPLYTLLAGDVQESVRRVIVEHTAELLLACKDTSMLKEILEAVTNLMNDRSWRVRFCIAQCIIKIANAFGPLVVRSSLLEVYVKLLQDDEAEVRVASCLALAGFCQHLEPQQILDTVLPQVNSAAIDTAEYVRAALATTVLELAPMLGKKSTIDFLLKPFLLLLRDSSADVRLNVISKLEHVHAVLGIEQLAESLLPAVDDLTHDKQWRVRLAIIEKIPVLAAQLGLAFYQEQMVHRTSHWLQDTVAAIRQTAAMSLCQVSKLFGTDWTRDHIIPEVAKLADNENYLFRITVLSCLGHLAQTVSQETLFDAVLPIVLSKSSDKVPNVRFNVAKVLLQLRPLITTADMTTRTQACLASLVEDSDEDVQYFTKQALEAYK